MAYKTPLPDALHDVAFTVAEARQLGVRRGRLAGGDLHRPFRGIRSWAVPADIVDLCKAYLPKLGVNQRFSHVTAAHLLEIPVQWNLVRPGALHITTVGGDAASGKGITGHRAHKADAPHIVHDLPVMSPTQTFFDLATVSGHKWIVVAGDALVGGTNPLCAIEQLTDALRQRAGTRGSARARKALERVRLCVDSPMETLLRLLLVDAGLAEPIVNRRYWSAGGLYLGKADLSYPQWRITIEYEGDQHRTDPAQFSQDIRRYARFGSAEWEVIRVEKSGLLEHPGEVLQVVRATIETQQRRIAKGFIRPEPSRHAA
ncbi:MAG: hypothetical protein ABI310_04005 [Microbacteriaceae bacterium]